MSTQQTCGGEMPNTVASLIRLQLVGPESLDPEAW